MAVFMQPIYTQTVGVGGAATVTFNNIPQGFTDLKVVVSARSSFATGDAMWLKLGTGGSLDSNSVYSNTRNYGTNGAASSDRWLNGTFTLYFASLLGNAGTANTFNSGEVYIPNYTSGSFKQIIYDGATSNNSATAYWQQDFYAALYRNTAPVTNLQFGTFNGGNFVQNTTFTLYGVSNIYDTQTPAAPTVGTVTDQAGLISVAFTPVANDQAESYVVTSTPSSVSTYGAVSPISTPATIGTSYTYQVASVNSLGTSASAASSAITTANSYTAIATTSAPSGTLGGITFINIPQKYRSLQLRLFMRSVNTGGAYGTIYTGFNGDTFAANNYWNHTMQGDGSSVNLAGAVGQQVNVITIPWNSVTSGNFATVVIDLVDYADTNKYKTVRYLVGWEANGTGRAGVGSAVWQNFAPISSIYMSPDGGWAQYSHAALYGIA